MEKVLSWFVENYELVILIAACILDLVLFLFGVFKKKVNDPLKEVLTRVPYLVSAAERAFGSGHGQEKKRLVIDTCISLYKKLTGLEVREGSEVFKFIDGTIESVLETPQKKGK